MNEEKQKRNIIENDDEMLPHMDGSVTEMNVLTLPLPSIYEAFSSIDAEFCHAEVISRNAMGKFR